MSLIRDIIFWLLIKCWKIALTLLVFFLAILVYVACDHYWQMAKNDMSSYEEKIARMTVEVAKELDIKEKARQEMVKLKKREPWFLNPWHIAWSWEYDYQNGVYQGADGAAKRAIQTKQELERGLSEAKTGRWWLIGVAEQAWARSFSFLGLIVFTIVFVPVLWKAFWFYVVAPIANKAPPIQVDAGAKTEAVVSSATSVQEVYLTPGDKICTRSDWVNAYPSDGVTKNTRLLWSWRAPLVSYASGLRELTEWRIMGATTQKLKLCSGTEPNLKITKITLGTQSALVVRPSSIVALSGDLELSTHWKLASIHSWITGRLRHIVISGCGTLYLCGYGDVKAETTKLRQRMSDQLLIAHEPCIRFRAVRTETFWPFLRNKAPLYDLQFEDEGIVIYQAARMKAAEGSTSTTERFQNLLDLLLKPLGF